MRAAHTLLGVMRACGVPVADQLVLIGTEHDGACDVVGDAD